MKILVLNAGSSSQKSCLYQVSEELPQHPPSPLWEAHIDWSVSAVGVMKVRTQEKSLTEELAAAGRSRSLSQMLHTLVAGETQVLEGLAEIDIVGHRVVHGGVKYSQATLVTEEVKGAIARLSNLAPAHNPVQLEGIEAIEQVLGEVPQIAVFDTAFHSHKPLEAAVYPLPYEWFEKGIRRYGFHGISHQYCAQRAAQILGKPLEEMKLITCHLGNGCSLAAIRGGRSVETTMGFTPLEGLMMGSRSGSIDPAILIYLIEEHQFNAEQLDRMLNQASGLKGISGIAGDMRAIHSGIAQGNERARLAFEMYVHRLRAGIGAMLANLGGLDALIFTAGIGENDATVREKACQGWEFLGLKLDGSKNASSPVDEDIAAPDSAIRVLVLHTEEDWAIAQQCWHYLLSSSSCHDS